MGLVHAEITLKNAADEVRAREGLINKEDIRQVTVDALADTGAYTLVINEAVRKELGLDLLGTAPGRLANGISEKYNLAGPLEIRWKNRSTNMDALVIPNARDVLLGAIPLEAMDLIVNPLKEEVIGAHGDEILFLV